MNNGEQIKQVIEAIADKAGDASAAIAPLAGQLVSEARWLGIAGVVFGVAVVLINGWLAVGAINKIYKRGEDDELDSEHLFAIVGIAATWAGILIIGLNLQAAIAPTIHVVEKVLQ